MYNLFKDLGQKILFQIILQQNLQIFNKEKRFVGFFGACYLEKLLLVLLKKNYYTKFWAKHICSKYLVSGVRCNAIFIKLVKWRKKLRTEKTVCNQKICIDEWRKTRSLKIYSICECQNHIATSITFEWISTECYIYTHINGNKIYGKYKSKI